jgi:hypothetical protein
VRGEDARDGEDENKFDLSASRQKGEKTRGYSRARTNREWSSLKSARRGQKEQI